MVAQAVVQEREANDLACRTLVYVEGDATNDKYEDAEGKPRTALSIVQRESPLIHQYFTRESATLTVTDPKATWRSSASPGEMLPPAK